jgi:predicted ATPase/DNA-binding winged helix-turn-helix (wHTH) protein
VQGTVADVKTSASPLIYQSGQVEIDLGRRELRVRGVPAPIGDRAFEIVEVLVQAAGEVVTIDHLMESVWPGAIVEENTIWVHISAARKALGPDRGKLKNQKGRGYRLLGPWIARARTPIGEVDADQDPRPSTLTVSNNLPVAGTNLIGRDVAVQQLQNLLSAYRVVTLTGPGGIGKTRLALAVARSMLGQGQSDVWLVELASLSDPDLVPSTVANALGLRGLVETSAEAVARAIGQRKILLLLDNCEHVIDAAAMLAETVVRQCPQAAILTTSREVLRIDGEQVYRVHPLDVPNERDTPDGILKSSAVHLFLVRIKAVNSAFLADETNLPDIAAICQRLDGIPLAIEFAAARAAMIGASEVAAHLDSRFSLLTAGRRTKLARHQTLRTALDWSYDLLTAAGRRLLRHLAVFPAGFTSKAAAAVMQDAGHQTTVIDGIEDLVAKSLVMLDGSASGGRWRLLQTIRAYALEKLEEEAEAERALRRHAEYFLDLLTPTGIGSWEPAREALVRYSREVDNIRAALDWCFSPGGDVSMGAAITAAFVPIWHQLALLGECRRRAEAALAYLGDNPNGDGRVRMQLHIGRGQAMSHTSGRREEAAAALLEGSRIAESLGDTVSQMYALWGLWISHAWTGNYRTAGLVAEQFLRLATETSDPARCFQGHRLMGTTMSYRGNQPSARSHLDRGMEMHRQSLTLPASPAWFGHDMSNNAQSMLARVLVLQGFLDQARHMAQACVDRPQRAGQKLVLLYALIEAAFPIAILDKDMDAAAKYVTLYTDVSREVDLSFWSILGRCLEGVLRIKQGNFDAGVDILRASLAACDEVGGTSRYPSYLGALSEGLAGLGRTDEARLTLERALDRAERDGEEWCIPDLLCIKGKLVLSEPDALSAHSETAEQCFREAIDLAQKQGALLWELRGASHLAHLWLEQRRPNDAWQILAPVYGRFVEGLETPDLRAAKLLLDSTLRGRARRRYDTLALRPEP